MKKQFGLSSIIVVTLFIVLCVGCREPGGAAKVVDPFTNDLTQGQVRVVLLRACPDASVADQSTFVVTYGVEVPTDGAFSDLSFSSNDEIALLVRGKPVAFRSGFSSAAMGFGDLPRQTELRQPALPEGRAMLFQDLTFPDLEIEAKHMDIRLRFSWRGSSRSFDFQGVPVAYRSAGPGA